MLLARSAAADRSAQSYQGHIHGVCNRIDVYWESLMPYLTEDRAARYGAMVKAAGVYHDLGKLNKCNQKVLNAPTGQALPVDHRDAGVKHLLGDARERAMATLVYAHHKPGLPDLNKEKRAAQPFRFANAVADSDEHLVSYLMQHEAALGYIHPIDPTPGTPDPLTYRILLSVLVDADYSDAGGQTENMPLPRWAERQRQLDAYVKDLQKHRPDDARNSLRQAFYDYCRTETTESSLAYCDAPVGSGKTTAVMAQMLQLAIKHDLRRIFVIAPYTNLISQTVKVLRQSLVLPGEIPEAIVAEHHHQADFEDVRLRHLAITWSAPIVVTTAVQFFETLSSSQPARLRKLHHLPGSGIILDESHANLPDRLMPLAWRWLTKLTKDWGCKVCLSSGTVNKFWQSKRFQSFSNKGIFQAEALLAPDLTKRLSMFEAQRVHLEAWEVGVRSFENVSTFIKHMVKKAGPRLVVMNTIQSAAYLAKAMRKKGHDVLHLSTALTPKDREAVLTEIERRLQCTSGQENWTLVATSIVECGLDFSFRSGFADMRTAASYIQLSGRIGRNGEYDDASLELFEVSSGELTRNEYFEDDQTIFRKQLESEGLALMSGVDIITEAFDRAYKQTAKKEWIESLCKAEKNYNFPKVNELFQVIEDSACDLVVVDPNLIESLKKRDCIRAVDLQKGSVNIRRKYLNRLMTQAFGKELYLLEPGQYDNFMGYMCTLINIDD